MIKVNAVNSPHEALVDPEIVHSQLKLSHDKFRSGRIAASIVKARIHNYSRSVDDVPH